MGTIVQINAKTLAENLAYVMGVGATYGYGSLLLI